MKQLKRLYSRCQRWSLNSPTYSEFLGQYRLNVIALRDSQKSDSELSIFFMQLWHQRSRGNHDADLLSEHGCPHLMHMRFNLAMDYISSVIAAFEKWAACFSALHKGGIRYSGFARPFLQAKSLPLMRDKNSNSSVDGLLQRCRPSAIIWRIWTIALLAIQSQSFRAWPHVGDESFERIDPSSTHGYATRTISEVLRMLRLSAAFYCSSPSMILARVRPPVLKMRFRSSLGMQAAAALSVAVSKIATCDYRCLAAITQALPFKLSIIHIRKTDNEQPAESFSGNVFESWTAFSNFVFSHAVHLIREWFWLEPLGCTTIQRLA